MAAHTHLQKKCKQILKMQSGLQSFSTISVTWPTINCNLSFKTVTCQEDYTANAICKLIDNFG